MPLNRQLQSGLSKAAGILSPTVYAKQQQSQMLQEQNDLAMRQTAFKGIIESMKAGQTTPDQAIPALQQFVSPETANLIAQSIKPTPNPEFNPEIVNVPGLPEGYQVLRTSPKSVRVIDSIGGRQVDWSEEETSDGRVGLYKNNEFVDWKRGPDGEPIKTGAQARHESTIEARKGRENRLDKKQRTNVENQASDDLRQDAAGIKEMESELRKLETILESGDITPLSSKAMQNSLSNLLNTNVRAQAELESFKTFGDLGERLSQAVSRFVTGGYTEESVNQIRSLVSEFRNKYVDPTKQELGRFYRDRVFDQGGNPSNVIMPSFMGEDKKDRPVEYVRDENGNYVKKGDQ